MHRIYRIVVILPPMLLTAWAQDDPAGPTAIQQQEVLVRLQQLQADMKKLEAERVTAKVGAVMGPTVKGAPYSGTEINESTQVLSDGTRIHNENQTMVYRDSEGRVRRETPDEITIWDPVANTSYLLDPKAQTARRMPLGKAVYSFSTGKGVGTTQVVEGPGAGFFIASAGVPAPGAGPMTVTVGRGGRGGVNFGYQTGKPESLGQQAIEGVKADGTRMTSSIPAGAIGNDRPIQSTSENWYSSELQTLIKSTHSDPRTGDESFRLTNISRVEPAPYLFQIPAGYEVIDRK